MLLKTKNIVPKEGEGGSPLLFGKQRLNRTRKL
jgi:hypothetical protein